MKVLMISTDKKILEQGSSVQKRMQEYGSLVDELDIIVCAKNGKQIVLDNNVQVFPTNSKSKIFYFWDAVRVAKKNIQSDVDLVTTQDPFETGLAGWMISERLKAKLQLQIHTDFLSPHFISGSLKNRIRVILAKFLLPKADSIRVVSERIKQSLTTYNLRLTTVSVLPIFVDVEKIKSSPINVDLDEKYPQFDFILLMTSRLEPEKNIELAINAMKDILKENSNAGLVIAGSGSLEKELKNHVQNLGLEDNVKFEGWVEDLSSFYKTADVFLNTSNYEGYGMTLIMSASADCPITTTNVGIVGESINKDNSLVFEVGDKKSLVDSISKLIENSSLAGSLSKRAQEAVSKLDSKEEHLKKYKQSWEI